MRLDRSAIALSTCLVIAACGGGGDSPPLPRTAISYRGQAADYISQGHAAAYDDSTATVRTTYNAGYFRTQFMLPNAAHWWNLDLATPNGEPLVPGAYIDAWRASFRNGHNGLDFFGDGRGCNEVFGSFVVLEIGFDTTGRMNRFAADFDQRCETVTSPKLQGSVRINSSIPLNY